MAIKDAVAEKKNDKADAAKDGKSEALKLAIA